MKIREAKGSRALSVRAVCLVFVVAPQRSSANSSVLCISSSGTKTSVHACRLPSLASALNQH